MIREVHLNPAELMAARNGETVITRIANWDSGIEVAFDIVGGEMAALEDGIGRVVLTPEQFQQVAEAKGAGHELTGDDGIIYRASVWS